MPLPTQHSRATFGALKASVDPLPDHGALKLGESTADLKHELLGGVTTARDGIWTAVQVGSILRRV